MRSVRTRIFVGRDGGEACCISGDLLAVMSTVDLALGALEGVFDKLSLDKLTAIFGTLRIVEESQISDGLHLDGDLLYDGDRAMLGGYEFIEADVLEVPECVDANIGGDRCIGPEKTSNVDSRVCKRVGGAGSDKLGLVYVLNSCSDLL